MKELLCCTMDIGEQMLVCGAEVHRVEDSIKRMCLALGASRVDIFIITSSMIATVYDESGTAFTQTRRIMGTGTDIERLHRLNQLSRTICEKKPSVEQIRADYQSILNCRPYPFWLECLSYGIIAASFALFFGGTATEGAVSFFVGILLKFVILLTDKTVLNKIFSRLLATFLACALGYGAVKMGWIANIDMVIIGNIMTLIPGVGLTNALRDLLTGDSMTGLLRLIEAAITALAIAAGYILFVCMPGYERLETARAMNPEILQIVTGFLGSLGFAILYNIRGKKLLFAALGGFLSWTIFVLLQFWIPGEALRYFAVAVTISVYAEIMARLLKTPTTTFLITSLIPLIPGGSLYYTMSSALEGNLNGFLDRGLYTLQLAIALALGIVLTTAVAKLIPHAAHHGRIQKK
ncbi:MAG: threonine/serine exporter family protein [Clostridia bacterium]|nr:threonine/serine exporter family protein [Clostridia bacterium]